MRMKKRVIFLCCMMMIFLTAGCGNDGNASRKVGSQAAGVSEVLQAGMAKENIKAAGDTVSGETSASINSTEKNDAETSKSSESEQPQSLADASEKIDVDLTKLSGTMVYSEVYNMMVTPENYIGKTVKMDGIFSLYHDEQTGMNYFACIISDATACCSQGIEFVLTEDYSYPEDYPEVGGEICVAGVFDTYEEGEYTYCTLRNAKMLY